MRIAGHLGMSLRQVEALDADEILWWEAQWAIDPWGDQRQDMRFAMLCQVVAAMVMQNPPPLTTFMLYPEGESKPAGPISAEALSGIMGQTQAWMTNGDDSR